MGTVHNRFFHLICTSKQGILEQRKECLLSAFSPIVHSRRFSPL
jgi:hypothetical protein